MQPCDSLITISPWSDPVVEANGYSATDPYVEMFWLPILGPTATWLLRRFAHELAKEPSGATMNIEDLARSLGVTYSPGKHNSFSRALHRCVMFGVAHEIALVPHTIVAVRTILPVISQRHLSRLPQSLQQAHSEWGASLTVVA